MLKKKLFIHILLATIFLFPLLSFSANPPETTGTDTSLGRVTNPISAETINEFIKKILEGVIKLGIPIVALAVIYSGFLFVEARGNSEKLKKAKDALLYTLIGAAILIGSWAIAQLISETILSL
jgi:hypothetical protein